MDNCLLLQKHSHIYLLVKYPDRYHIITVNDKLDEWKEESILAGNYSDAAIDEMGLTRETIMTKDLRGVAIGGCRAGDIIVLYTKDQKRRYVLSDEYDDKDINAVFSGIQRFQAPKNGGSKSRKKDWRAAMQTESTRKIMRPIGIFLNFSGGVCSVCTFLWGKHHPLWSVLCLMLITVSIGIYFTYPQYFSLMGNKEYHRVGYSAEVQHLIPAIAAPAFALSLLGCWGYQYPNWTPLLIGGAVLGIIVTIILCVFSRELKENASFTVALLIVSMFLSIGIVGQVNHLANFTGNAPQQCTVIDTERSTSDRDKTRFYCTVATGTGKEMEVQINGSTYYQLHSGDTIELCIGRGAFGIEYAYFPEEE